MKKPTTKQIVRGFTRALKERGVTVQNGRARDAHGRFVSKESLARRVARLRRQEEKPAPKKPKKQPPDKQTPKPKKSIFERGPQAVETRERKLERIRLRDILGYNPSEAQLDRAMKRRLEERRPHVKQVTWQEVDRWLVNVPQGDLIPKTAAERREMLRVYSLDFYTIMKMLDERGVLDHERFRKVAARFGVPEKAVYDVFFGYPPSVGSRIAA